MGSIIGQVDAQTLIWSLGLVFVASTVTTLLSAVLGAMVAFNAAATPRYSLLLGALFVPFALGSSVWAFVVTKLSAWIGLQAILLDGNNGSRAIALLTLTLARAVPLGVLFCATSLHYYSARVKPYLSLHQMPTSFFLASAIRSLPPSVLLLVGLIGGGMIASESSLPLFLYRANPGTPPETLNLLFARLYREFYPVAGPVTTPTLAAIGGLISMLMLLIAFVGARTGMRVLDALHNGLAWMPRAEHQVSMAPVWLLRVGVAICILPFVCFSATLWPIAAPIFSEGVGLSNMTQFIQYAPISVVGVVVGSAVVAASLCAAIGMRYRKRQMWDRLRKSNTATSFLMLPSYLPAVTLVVALGLSMHVQFVLFEYVIVFLSHFLLHISIFFFICISFVASIPERHVEWQRRMHIRLSFSLVTDGLKRHNAVIVSLVGVAVVQVVTDGIVSRWFSYLLKSPDEILYAAVFGRLPSAHGAAIIVLFVGALALALSAVIGHAYARDFGKGSAHG